jgi:hypothetical protein
MNGFAETDLRAPLHTPAGPPTKAELLVHYPPKFTWHQLKTFVNSGCALLECRVSVMLTDRRAGIFRDLGLLKRDKNLERRYDDWAQRIIQQHGSLGEFRI